MIPPSLAVIVPLYNGEAFIGETLESLARQTVPLTDVIVVDDGSSDSGPAIARGHALRPTVIEQAHAGVAAARNRGALAAGARFIAFLDQDDLWLPQRHERILAYLKWNPECRALATNEQAFYLASDRASLAAIHEPLHRGAEHPDVAQVHTLLEGVQVVVGAPRVIRTIDTATLLRGTIAVTTSYVFERELFFVAGGCPTFARSMDDYWGLLNVSRLTEIALLDEPSVLYRIHPTSTSMSTAWPMPLLTSFAAARYGGNLVPADRVRAGTDGPSLSLFWQHQLLELARSGSRGAFDAIALTHLLASGRRDRRSLTWRLVKAGLRSRFTRGVQRVQG